MKDSQDLIRQQFGRHADNYVTSAVHARGKSLARLVELIRPQSDWIVLDVSTGAGHTALKFAPLVAHVDTSDLTAEMLETARQLAAERGIQNVAFKPADAHALPFADSTYDLVTNRLALHHYADAHKAIEEMARVTKPGGLVALVDNVVPPDQVTAGYINHFEQVRDPSHNWAYPVVRLESYFAAASLLVERSETLREQIELGPWADRMGASSETKDELRKLLLDAPQAVREVLQSRAENDKVFFDLTEAIIIGRKI